MKALVEGGGIRKGILTRRMGDGGATDAEMLESICYENDGR